MLRSTKKRLLLILSIATMSGYSVATERSDGAVSEFLAYMRSTIHRPQGQAHFSETRARQGCRQFTVRYVDMEAMARSAVPTIWNHMSARQRAAYHSVFNGRILQNCVQASWEFRGKKLNLLGVRRTGKGDKLVATRIGLEDEPGRMIVWRLRDDGSRLRVVDVISDGRSYVAGERDEYAAVLELRNGDIDTFIQTIRP